MNLVPRIIRAALRVVVGLIVVVAVTAVVVFALLPRLGLYQTLTVLSGSMEPTFSSGDVIVVTPQPLSEVRKGQVISYEAPVGDRHVVSHRVVEVITSGPMPVVRTQGDANAAPDPWTAQLQGDTAWKLRFVIPGAGWVIRLFRDPLVHRLLVLALPLALCAIWLREIWRPRERREEAISDAA